MYYEEFELPTEPTAGAHDMEYAEIAGSLEPDRPWLLTPYNSWVANPFYTGPDAPHPEEVEYYTEDDAA